MSGPNATIDRTQVLAGPAQLWWAVFSDTLVFPLDSAVGDPAGVGWTDAGGTNGGLTITTNQTLFSLRVDQVPDALGKRITERSVVASTSLAQGTLENLAIALNHDPTTAVTEDALAGWRKFEMQPGQDAMRPPVLAILVDGWAPGDLPLRRRTILRRVNSMESVGSGWTKDGQFLIPVSFEAFYVDATTSPVAWVDQVPV